MDITRMAFAANMLVNQVLGLKRGNGAIVTEYDRPRIITQALAYSAIPPARGGGCDDGTSEDRGARAAGRGCRGHAAVQVVINQSTQSLTHTASVREPSNTAPGGQSAQCHRTDDVEGASRGLPPGERVTENLPGS